MWHNAVRDVVLEAVVSIDGIECNRHVMRDARSLPDQADTVRVSYTRTSDFTRRDFFFSVVQVTGKASLPHFPARFLIYFLSKTTMNI
jgi:hypothetical protein